MPEGVACQMVCTNLDPGESRRRLLGEQAQSAEPLGITKVSVRLGAFRFRPSLVWSLRRPSWNVNLFRAKSEQWFL